MFLLNEGAFFLMSTSEGKVFKQNLKLLGVK